MRHVILALTLAVAAVGAAAAGPLKVVCTLTDLGWLAEQVGGDRVKVVVLCPGKYDPHFLPARPSLARKLGAAELLCYNGLDLEVGWLPVLVEKARNKRVRPGQLGDLDCSRALDTVLEVPARTVSRAEGDVHPYGNPHYLLDPRNGGRVAMLMAERMGALRPADAGYFRERAEKLVSDLEVRAATWYDAIATARETPLVHYTKQWEYLVEWLDLELLGAVEHRPGISPSPRHIEELTVRARAVGVRALIAAPWNHLDVAEKAAARMNCELVVLPAAAESVDESEDYIAMFELIIDRLAAATAK